MDVCVVTVRICLRSLPSIGLAWLGLFLTANVWGAPPRFLDDDNDRLKSAAFEEAEQPQSPHTLTPRAKSEPRPRKSTPTNSKPWQNTSLWGTVIGLFVVLGGCLSARVWLTRHGPVGFRGLPVEALELLGKRTIEPRVSLHLVRCGPKILVLGVSPDGVRTLTEITDPVEIDLLAGACRRKESHRSPAPSFATKFRQVETADPHSHSRGA